MQPEEKQLEASAGASWEGLKAEAPEEEHTLANPRKLRKAALKAKDTGRRVAEMILECNEDGEHGDGDDGERDEEEGERDEEAVGRDVPDDSYHQGRSKPVVKARWSASEDAKLKASVDMHGSGNWRVVSGGVVEVVAGGVVPEIYLSVSNSLVCCSCVCVCEGFFLRKKTCSRKLGSALAVEGWPRRRGTTARRGATARSRKKDRY